MPRLVDTLGGQELLRAVAEAQGVPAEGFDPWPLFLRETRVMIWMDDEFRVSVETGRTFGWAVEYVEGRGTCPIEACMRALLEKVAVLNKAL